MIKFVLLASFLISPAAHSQQQIQIEKVKGNRAVIQFSGKLIPGKTYSLSEEAQADSLPQGTRRNLVGASLGFISTTYFVPSLNESRKNTDMSLSVRYGWNWETFELGAVLGYKNIDSDYSDQHYSSFTGGGFLDYNLNANRPGEKTIFGLTGEGIFGSLAPNSGNNGSTLEAFAGVFCKWFGLTESTALRGDLGYDYIKTDAGASSNTEQGLILRGGIATYF